MVTNSSHISPPAGQVNQQVSRYQNTAGVALPPSKQTGREDTVYISREARALQASYAEKETRLEDNFTNDVEQLEREYQQDKNALQREYQQKKKSLGIHVTA